MNVSLTDEQVRFIEAKVKTGRYQTAAEVVREGIRLLMDHEAEEQRRFQAWRDEVRRKIDAGWDEAIEGKLVDGKDAFKRLEERLDARRKPRR